MVGQQHSRWLFTRADCSKIFKSKIKACPVHAGLFMALKHHISFATDLAANFVFDWFRIMPDIVSKLLSATIWSCCAVLLESEQTPYSQTGCQLGANRGIANLDIISSFGPGTFWRRDEIPKCIFTIWAQVTYQQGKLQNRKCLLRG